MQHSTGFGDCSLHKFMIYNDQAITKFGGPTVSAEEYLGPESLLV